LISPLLTCRDEKWEAGDFKGEIDTGKQALFGEESSTVAPPKER
jgi:hypothetical protein